MPDAYWCRHCGNPQPAYPHHHCDQAPDGPFADQLAAGASAEGAAVALGMHPKHGSRVLRRIRNGLGWQAV